MGERDSERERVAGAGMSNRTQLVTVFVCSVHGSQEKMPEDSSLSLRLDCPLSPLLLAVNKVTAEPLSGVIIYHRHYQHLLQHV